MKIDANPIARKVAIQPQEIQQRGRNNNNNKIDGVRVDIIDYPMVMAADDWAEQQRNQNKKKIGANEPTATAKEDWVLDFCLFLFVLRLVFCVCVCVCVVGCCRSQWLFDFRFRSLEGRMGGRPMRGNLVRQFETRWPLMKWENHGHLTFTGRAYSLDPRFLSSLSEFCLVSTTLNEKVCVLYWVSTSWQSCCY